MKKNALIIVLISIIVFSGGIGSIFIFSNDVNKNISMKIAENYIREECNTDNITIFSSTPCNNFNCWIFGFTCNFDPGDFYINEATIVVWVKWYRIIDIVRSKLFLA